MTSTLAAIPYYTFPTIQVGPVNFKTFGLIVAIGMIAGIWVAARYLERLGFTRDFVYGFAMKLVLWGLVGARLAWVITHPEQIHSPIDVIAVWEGGLTFTGGFIAAAIVAIPLVRRFSALQRWQIADGVAIGLAIGVGIGRLGCYAVGEHLGGPTSFFLGTRYLGGETREGPLVVGQVINNTSLYEFLHLMVLAAILGWLLFRGRDLVPGTAMGVFCVWYGIARFGTDFLRTYDERVLGLTAAQWLCIVLFAIGVWILATTGRRRTRLSPAGAISATVAGTVLTLLAL